jgi:hypothetical protein
MKAMIVTMISPECLIRLKLKVLLLSIRYTLIYLDYLYSNHFLEGGTGTLFDFLRGVGGF